MSYCIYKVITTGKIGVDVDTKFPSGGRQGYTVIECGLKKREDAEARVREIERELPAAAK